MDSGYTNGYTYGEPKCVLNDSISLEEDVLELNDKINYLQKQVTNLSESQATNEVRYSKVKQENANLLTKIHALEEQLRDIEIQSEERNKQEEQRHLKSMDRQEREKCYELEQHMNKVYSLQQELFEAKEESSRNNLVAEQLKLEKCDLLAKLNLKSEEIDKLTNDVINYKELNKNLREEISNNKVVIKAFNEELEQVKCYEESSSLPTSMDNMKDIDRHYQAMVQEVRKLRSENKILRETNEELQAQLLNNHLEEGRSLLKQEEIASSLANEMANLTQDELRHALKEQKDCNAKLRAYIDGILLNIVENYPQLLEVKPN